MRKSKGSPKSKESPKPKEYPKPKESLKTKNIAYPNIKPKYSNCLSELLCDNEKPFFSSSITFQFPPSQKSTILEKSHIILTYGFIYIFSKSIGKVKLEITLDLFKCQEITLSNESYKDKKKQSKEKNKKDKKPDKDDKHRCITIKTTDLPDCYTLFYEKGNNDLFEEISKIVFILSNRSTSERQIPILYPEIPIKYYAIPYLLYKRSLYYIHSDMKINKIDRSLKIEGSSYFLDNKICNKGNLIFTNTFIPGQFSSYYARAIASIPHIDTIVFHNFNNSINEFVEAILTSNSNINKIIFQNYPIEAPTFQFHKLEDELKQEFIFFNTDPTILHNFINGLQQSSCKITKIFLSKVAIQSAELANIFEQMSQIESFINLKSFKLANPVGLDQFPLEPFANFLKSHEKLETLTISKVDAANGTLLLYTICDCNPSIYELHLNSLMFQTILKLKNEVGSTILPETLILVDFSYSKFNCTTLVPILHLIAKVSVKGSLMVNFSHLYKMAKYIKAFESTEFKKCYGTIIDLNWSGNFISNEFFDFIHKQNNLKFISLMNIDPENQDLLFEHLLRVMREVRPIGIEIGCESFKAELVKPFLSALKESSQLEHLCFESQDEQNEITASLSDVITSLPNLKEISINIPKLEQDAYIKLGASIISNKSILACNFMKYEYKDLEQKHPEIEALYSSIQKLKIPTTMEQRAEVLFLTQQENEYDEFNVSTPDITKTINFNGSNHIEEISEDENINADEIVIEEEEEDVSN